MRNLSDVINKMLAIIPEGESSAKALRELLTSPFRLAFDVPESAWGWNRLLDRVRAIATGSVAGSSMPLRFAHADRWRAAVLAIWRDCTIEDLERDGLAVVEKPPRESWDARVRAALGPDWDVQVRSGTANDDGEFVGFAQKRGEMPKPLVEIRLVGDVLHFFPVLMEATGLDAAMRAWEAFVESRVAADRLNGRSIVL